MRLAEGYLQFLSCLEDDDCFAEFKGTAKLAYKISIR